jgi:hypothetical protein
MKKLLPFVFILFLTGKATAQLTYKDVAPIFFKNCTGCHNPYGHGMPFLTYTQTSNYAAAIENALVDSKMPPWPPDPTYTRFIHERIISKTDKNKILNWISGGMLPGDTTKIPPPPVYTKYQINAPPDLELSIPTFTSNASTDDSYVCFSLPSGLTQDRIIRAFEIVAGNPSIVHHVIANVDTTGTTTSDLSGHCYNITGDFSIGCFAPSAPPCIFPARAPLKMGITIKRGSKIVLQVHYPAGSAGQKDNTKIRLYFYPVGTKGVRPVIVKTLLQNWDLNIPANTVRKFTAAIPIDVNYSGLAVFPHSHKLATTILNYMYKGTDTIPLIRIKEWDFNWQGYYTFPRLVKSPAGYTLFSSHVYDNTVNNPNNPNNPPKDVKAGTSTNDEMLYDSFQYLIYQPGDENYNIDSIIALDPITSVEEERPVTFRTYTYPNPFQNKVQIGYVLEQPSRVTIEIYSMVGGLIQRIEAGTELAGQHEVTWDGKSTAGIQLANGTYLYVVKTDTQQSYGKLQLLSENN